MLRRLKGRSASDAINIAVMLMRGVVYQLLRGRRPRLLFMERGARILGFASLDFEGPLKVGRHAMIDARWCARLSLGRDVTIGDFSILRCSGSSAFLCPGVQVGARTSFGPYCNIGGGYGLTIGSDCLFGPYVSVHPESHVTDRRDLPIRKQGIGGAGIVIGSDNWFGAKATILDGAVIGDGNIIAASSVYKGDIINNYSILAGVPAKIIGER